MKSLKKLIASALAALGFAAITLALPAGPAQAQAITCQQVGPGPTWPLGPYSQYCGGSSQASGQYVSNALIGVNGTAGQTLLKNKMIALNTANTYNGVFYLFPDATKFRTWALAHMPAAQVPSAAAIATSSGWTQYQSSTNPMPLYTVVFEKILSTGQSTNIGSNLQAVAGHESGHWLDALLAHLQTPSTSVPNALALISNGDFYRHLRLFDENALNTLTDPGDTGKCVYKNHGLFNIYQWTDTSGVKKYFCVTGTDGSAGSGSSLISTFAGYPNNAILAGAYPGIWGGLDAKGPDKELFAQTYVMGVVSYTDISLFPAVTYVYFRQNNQAYSNANLYKCTIAFITYIYQNNALPPASYMQPLSCPTS